MTRLQHLEALARGYMPDHTPHTNPVTFPDTNTWENELKKPVETYPTFHYKEVNIPKKKKIYASKKVQISIHVPPIVNGKASISGKPYTKKQIHARYTTLGYYVGVTETEKGYLIHVKERWERISK